MPEWFRKRAALPLHGARIEDYAVIGDCETAALVSREGSIDWLCWPSFASGACFAALLGTSENGFWRIAPAGKILSISRRYIPGTMILETTFVTKDGEVCLTDFMPPRGKHSDVVRKVRAVRGKVAMRMVLTLRFDYGLTIPWVTRQEHVLSAVAGPNLVLLRASCSSGASPELHGEAMSTVSDFIVRAKAGSDDEEHCFVLSYGSSTEEAPEEISVAQAFAETHQFWTTWSSRSTYKGRYADAVQRSLMVLKTLTYRPTGGVVAAVTAGLPERIGGERNWDYRYCWLRDTSFTLLVLLRAGYTDEAIEWRRWLLRAIAGAPDQLQSLYGIDGGRRILEWNASWLRGYEDSRPVRIGNAAFEQFQLDVYGEVASALSRAPELEQDLRAPASQVQAALIDHLCKIWTEPDEGIWETRGGRKHFTHSKVMAWVALDRAIQRYEKFDGDGDIKRWRKNRDMLHKEICAKAFNKKLNAFTQSYGSKVLDAACLQLGMVGFLPMNDPRIVGTIEAIQKNLTQNGLILRYQTKTAGDGLRGGEGTFLACSFWMVVCLHAIGRIGEASAMFERLLALSNDVGLLSEEYDSVGGRMLGNFPQALSHLALCQAAFTIGGQWVPGS